MKTPGPSFRQRFANAAEEIRRLGASAVGTLFAAQGPPSAIEFQDGLIYWAMRNLPIEEATKHFVICGMTGSGKTTAIRLFLQSIAPRFLDPDKAPEQLILFDAKCDLIPILAAMGLPPKTDGVWILNPIDQRCAVWNLGEAAQTPVMARYIATLLVPEEKRSTAPYFADAARQLVFAVILGLNRILGGTWSLRDLLCALDSLEHVRDISAHHPRAARIARAIYGDDKHSGAVFATLGTRLARFEEVAGLWHAKKNAPKFSLKTFLKKPGVLLLGNDPMLKESLWPINAILLKALTEEILRGPNSSQPRYWFVLDEFRAMEKVDCVHDLLNRGRSKGASVMLGIQSIPGLREIYGSDGAEDILSQCSNKSFLRAGDPKTAEWAESYFGKTRSVESSYTESWGQQGQSYSVQSKLEDRALLLSSFFLDLPFPTRGHPFSMVSDVPSLRTTIQSHWLSDDVFAQCKPSEVNSIDAVEWRTDPDEQIAWPWTAAEEASYCQSRDQELIAQKGSTAPPQTRGKQNESNEPGGSK